MIRWWQVAGAMLAFAALATGVAAQAPQTPVNTLSELMAALRACWVPPPLDQSRAGMQITVQVSFRRNGELLGQPRITFESAGASEKMNGWPIVLQWPRCSNVARPCRSPRGSGTHWLGGR